MTSDLALHHFVTIRLIDASPADVEAVKRQLGISAGRETGEPDILVRFVPRLSEAGSMRHLAMGEAGFTDDAFIVEAGGQKARLFLDDIGGQCEIVCESGPAGVPLLVPIVNLTAMSKGYLPVHASAFQFGDVGVLASGWPHGGKTSMLVAFLAHGARFVSDDWLYIDREGRLYPLLQPVKLHDWQLEQTPQFRSRISSGKLRRMQLAKAADSLEQRLPKAARRRFPPASLYGLMTRYLNKKQRHVYVSPQAVFGELIASVPVPFQKVFLTLSSETPEIVVRPLAAPEAIERLVASLLYEWQEIAEIYLQFRYAFPNRAVPLLDELPRRLREMLIPLLDGKQIFTVYHPHPVPLEALYEKVSPYIKS